MVERGPSAIMMVAPRCLSAPGERSRPQGLIHEADWKEVDGDVRLVGRGVRDVLAIAPSSREDWSEGFERYVPPHIALCLVLNTNGVQGSSGLPPFSPLALRGY